MSCNIIEITIDGKKCSCERGEFLLDVARRSGFEIPTLCRHGGFREDGQGACRLCLVEVFDPAERGRSRIVVSCVFPVEKPCEVLTDSERVREDRAAVLMLLRERAPESPEIAELCKKYGAMDGSRFKPLDGEKCVMCGLCSMACLKLGSGAISTVGRGTEKKISTPYGEPSSACIGCGSCAEICPTGAISCGESGGVRRIWGREFALVRCERCGAPFATEEELKYAAEHSEEDDIRLCPTCRRSSAADVMARVFGCP